MQWTFQRTTIGERVLQTTEEGSLPFIINQKARIRSPPRNWTHLGPSIIFPNHSMHIHTVIIHPSFTSTASCQRKKECQKWQKFFGGIPIMHDMKTPICLISWNFVGNYVAMDRRVIPYFSFPPSIVFGSWRNNILHHQMIDPQRPPIEILSGLWNKNVRYLKLLCEGPTSGIPSAGTGLEWRKRILRQAIELYKRLLWSKRSYIILLLADLIRDWAHFHLRD